MGMEEVAGSITGLFAAGGVSALVAFFICDATHLDERLNEGCCPPWRRHAAWLLGLLMAILWASGFLCLAESDAHIDVEEVDEPIITESRRIIEDGFDVQTVSSRTDGVMVLTDNIIIPSGGFNSTDVRYIVMCEDDDGIETLVFGTSGRVTVREDVESWEDARLETVETAVERYTGTFFGVPVKDTKVEGRLFPDYVIHVPEGTLAEMNGE